MIDAADGGATTSTFLFGDQMDVTSGGVTKSATRPGFTITVTDPNVPPSDPIPATADQLSGALSSLEGSSEPAGDGENTPTDDTVAASGVSGGSESDPGAIAPGGGGTGGDVGTGAGVADAAETSAEQDENSQETAGSTVTGGVNLSGLTGRYKHSSSITAGTQDGTSTLDIPFSGGTASGGIFTVTLASNLTFPIPSAPGSLSFTGAGTESPFGLINGTSTLFPGSQFVLVEAFENSFPTDRIIGFAGTTTTTFPTTGATFYNYRRDFQLDSNVPFILKASGGDILADPALSAAPEAFAAIYWGTTPSSTRQRPFGFATGGVSGTGASQKSVGSLIVGAVITATVDGVTRTFIDGEMRGSTRVSSSQLPHFIEGPASTAFGGGSSFGQDIFFFGDDAGYFVLEGVETNSSGFKINACLSG